MKRRWVTLALALCLCFQSIAAVGNAEEAALPVLVMSWWGDSEVARGTQAGIDAFVKSKRSRLEVRSQAWETREAYVEGLSELLRAGQATGVVELDEEMLRLWTRETPSALALMNLEEYPDTLDLMQFSYLGLKGGVVDGLIRAVPMSVSSHVFFWNATAIRGLKQQVPEGEEGLLSLAAAFREQGGGYLLAADAESRVAMLITYLQSRYGQPWMDQATGRVRFTLEQVAEGMRYLRRFEALKIWPGLSEQGDVTQGFQEGRYLGVWAWDTLAPALAAALPDKAKLETSALLSEWAPYSGGFQRVTHMLAILEGTAEVERSLELVEYLLNGTDGAVALRDLRGTPDSEAGARAARRRQALNPAQTDASGTARSWARYPMPPGFDAAGLVGPDGVYAQVLEGFGAGTLSDMDAARALVSGVEAMLP